MYRHRDSLLPGKARCHGRAARRLHFDRRAVGKKQKIEGGMANTPYVNILDVEADAARRKW